MKFIYFGITYDNPCSPLHAHVLASSHTPESIMCIARYFEPSVVDPVSLFWLDSEAADN
jgi:hypothetical protein